MKYMYVLNLYFVSKILAIYCIHCNIMLHVHIDAIAAT